MTTLLMTPDAMTPPPSGPSGSWPPAEPLALPTKYELDPFQKHAVLGIHAGDHVFVTAKTGSGKTFVGEYLIARALAAGGRVFYTTPIKSLSNQKYHDLKRLFPTASVGILTGDIKMCPDADIVVMTAEILRNLFYKRGTATEGVGLTAAVSLERVVGVVMDEVHYIQDPDRGHVWEETMILCPRNLQLVLLSATMPSAASLAGWLADLHGRRTWLLSTTYRVVPLEHGVLSMDGSVRVLLDAKNNWNPEGYRAWLKEREEREDAVAMHAKKVATANRDRRQAGGSAASKPGQLWTRAEHDRLKEEGGLGLGADKAKAHTETPTATLQRTVRWLKSKAALPALFFVFSRKRCETLAASIESEALIDTSDAAAAQHIFDFHLSRHRTELETSAQYHTLRRLVTAGIAFHHSGLQPLLKEIVEVLFSRGFIRVLFATETFAVGLNMPTKTVVFLELEKYCDGGEKRPLRPDEYIQMAGRAGRRGLDTRGLVLYQPLGGHIDPMASSDLHAMMCGSLPTLESRMRFGYDFVLRLKLSPTPLPIAEQSYWGQQQREARQALGSEIQRLQAAVVELSGKFSTEQARQLQERDRLAEALVTTKNAAQRRARMELERWDVEHRTSPYLQTTWARLKTEQAALIQAQQNAAVWDGRPLLNVDAEERLLRSWGFLSTDTDACKITELGTAATECNETNCILTPLLCASGALAKVPAAELPVVMAAMLTEGGDSRDEEPPALGSHGLSENAQEALWWLSAKAEKCLAAEEAAGVASSVNFWKLSLLWVAVVARWQAGVSVPAIAAEFGLFEGNVLRGLLRVSNMLEELAAVAQIRGDLELLERLRSFVFLRGEIVTDSIYLRL
uniref:Helicase n=1 Tax=viral metagenome TaxID=1070528 RepID=A0A6C0D9Q4_9ZZZZ